MTGHEHPLFVFLTADNVYRFTPVQYALSR